MPRTVIELFEQSVRLYPDNVFLLESNPANGGNAGDFKPSTYSSVYRSVINLGAGLRRLGVTPLERVALLCENRNMWVVSELSIFYAGAVNVPLSTKLEPVDLIDRLRHSGAATVVTSRRELQKIRSIRTQLPQIVRVVVVDDIPDPGEGEHSASELSRIGATFLKDKARKEEFLSVGRSVGKDDIATVVYTSGTTSDPKGVMLSHGNYVSNVGHCLSLIGFRTEWTVLVLLPLDHCFAHVVALYTFMAKGAAVATVPQFRSQTEALRNIPMSLKKVRPHIILSVPAIARYFHKKLVGEVLPDDMDPDDARIRGLVREWFGGRLLFFISGGASLDTDLQKFFLSMGIPMYQGYGLSEASPVISTNAEGNMRLGSCGKVAEGVEVRILGQSGQEMPCGGTGEIVVRGGNVMKGYWNNGPATASALREGWLHTGDLGHLDEEGYLYVSGRAKSILISSDGEKYSPEAIEEAIESSSDIFRHVLLFCNQYPCTVAVIDVDSKRLESGAAGLERVKALLDRFRAGGDLAGSFPERWLPGAFVIADEGFSEVNGLVTPTMKTVRGGVFDKYRERIESACQPRRHSYNDKMNIKALTNDR